MALTVNSIMNAAYSNPTLVGLCILFGYAIGRFHQKRKMRRSGMGGMGGF